MVERQSNSFDLSDYNVTRYGAVIRKWSEILIFC